MPSFCLFKKEEKKKRIISAPPALLFCFPSSSDERRCSDLSCFKLGEICQTMGEVRVDVRCTEVNLLMILMTMTMRNEPSFLFFFTSPLSTGTLKFLMGQLASQRPYFMACSYPFFENRVTNVLQSSSSFISSYCFFKEPSCPRKFSFKACLDYISSSFNSFRLD